MHSSLVFKIITYFWKSFWLRRKSFDESFFFFWWEKYTSEGICFSFCSLENKIYSINVLILFFTDQKTKLCKGVRSLGFFWGVAKYWDRICYVYLYCWLSTPTNREIFGEYIVINVFLKTTSLLVGIRYDWHVALFLLHIEIIKSPFWAKDYDYYTDICMVNWISALTLSNSAHTLQRSTGIISQR